MTFLMPAETLIKSIACHNDNVKIYVLNEDLPQEWFANINRRLHFLDIQVVDVKYDPTLLDNVVVSNQFLTKMTFGRFLIPKLIPEDGSSTWMSTWLSTGPWTDSISTRSMVTPLVPS
jgi:lipopolysaccharide biosynthesis glycosyltransferase